MKVIGRLVLALAATAVGVAVVFGIIAFGSPDSDDATTGRVPVEAPLPRFVTAAPVEAAVSPPTVGVAGLADADWLTRTAKATGIPTRALAAYAGVAIQLQTANPSCGIGWNTLAGVGWVESHHGTISGRSLAANGDVTPALYGVALDGVETANIPDSDGGAIDGDATIDRAVGPFQTIPQTWRNWHVDANGDGVENPQNIDDATLAAAHYLCRASRSAGGLGTEAGWRQAVLSYNSSDVYLDDVVRAAARYQKLTAG